MNVNLTNNYTVIQPKPVYAAQTRTDGATIKQTLNSNKEAICKVNWKEQKSFKIEINGISVHVW